jgi:hypothetical protein
VTVLIEMIMDRGMGGGEFLQGLYISELRHRSFSSPERTSSAQELRGAASR